MFRIRRIFDDMVPVNREALRQVGIILSKRFPDAPEDEILKIGEKLKNPFALRFRPVLFVAENMRWKVLGFALVLHEPEINFCYLDWIATTRDTLRGGLGSALYERVRSECSLLGARGLFFECLPDTPEACSPELLKENIARLRFYERYGARPIIRTGYETPVNPGDTCMPFLVCDPVDSRQPLAQSHVKSVVRAILERKYAYLCPQEYVETVVASIHDNPARLRPFRHVRPGQVRMTVESGFSETIPLVINERHAIHHVHERGYVESPVRVRSILSELEKSGLFEIREAESFPDSLLHGVHDADFLAYLERACTEVGEKKSLYPYVFPVRNKTRPPRERSVLPGYYCIDTFTPIHRNAWPAARGGVNAALTAARGLLEGHPIAYALVRPPGHHAERRAFGGFCYLNNTAVAAHYLRQHGRVAILDIDYHHGNGQQDIFYNRSDILTVSIHGHPEFAYPYFTGFEDEIGSGEGEGFNLNLPLPESVNGEEYRKTLALALQRVKQFTPDYLVVALGLDTAANDPTGTWSLKPADFRMNGRMIGEAGLPVLVIQEGGYRTRSLGNNARNFFSGLAEVTFRVTGRKALFDLAHRGIRIRYEPVSGDPDKIRSLVAATGFFRDDEVAIAGELVEERLEKGTGSGYYFVIAMKGSKIAGYGCYGPIPCTLSSFDIYWIAVSPEYQGKGLGKILLTEMERLIHEAGGLSIYVETSTQERYRPTRSFYEHCGYTRAAVLEDFYALGDGKAIYMRRTDRKPADDIS